MRLLGIASAALALLVSASSQAADLRPVYKAPVAAPPPAYSWTGFYVGGHVGWADSDASINWTGRAFDSNPPLSVDLGSDGWFGGGQVGYNWQVSNWVLGIEADLGKMSLGKDLQFFGPRGDDNASADFGRYYTVTGRLGWAYDRALFYAKGGYVNARVSYQAGDTDGGNIDPSDFVSTTKNLGGWTIGGGLEYAFAPNWTVKLEYLYMDLKDVSLTNIDGDTFTFSNTVQTVKGGINYKFDWGKAPVMAKY